MIRSLVEDATDEATYWRCYAEDFRLEIADVLARARDLIPAAV